MNRAYIARRTPNSTALVKILNPQWISSSSSFYRHKSKNTFTTLCHTFYWEHLNIPLYSKLKSFLFHKPHYYRNINSTILYF